MKKIETSNAPKAVGPYSQAIIIQNMIFVSGQLPIDPQTGKMVEGDIRSLTKQVIKNLEAILNAAGVSLNKIVRTDVFLKDLKRDYAAMNEEYAVHFGAPIPPVRQTIQAAELPMGSLIEISCIAFKDS